MLPAKVENLYKKMSYLVHFHDSIQPTLAYFLFQESAGGRSPILEQQVINSNYRLFMLDY